MRTSSGGAVFPSLVILLTYGPRPISRAALRGYARMLPGVPVEQIAIFAGENVTARLERLLRAAGNQPVLLVHDDVTILPKSIERLTTVALRGTQVAVPVTNDNNCDHFVGSLPEGRLAMAALASAERSRDDLTRSVERVRPICMVGRASSLYDFLTFRVHDPLSTFSGGGDNLIVVDNAIAAHDLQCVSRIRSIHPAKDETLLVASMIVKDESAMLPDCLESLHGV
ncbi:MAG: hypothetical protein ACC652_07945, partial [Acidimicrobiales bacterium]